MKKIFVAFMVAMSVMSVMVMGPEKALAQTTETVEVEAAGYISDVDRATRAMNGLKWYVENNPNWNEKVVRMMIGRDGDTTVIAATWIYDGEVGSDTYRYSHDELVELDAMAMVLVGQGLAGTWMV